MINFTIPVKTKAEVAAEAVLKMKADLAKMDKALQEQTAVSQEVNRLKSSFEEHVRDTIGVVPEIVP